MKKWLLLLITLAAALPGAQAQGGRGFWHQEWCVEKGDSVPLVHNPVSYTHLKELQSCEPLDNVLEEMAILWSDDLPYIVMMILRSLSNLRPTHTELKVPAKFKSDEDPQFVRTLFEKSLVNYDSYQDYIEKFTSNWDVERIVFMDNLIIGTAMAELTSRCV